MQWLKAIEDAFELRTAATDYRCMPEFCTPASWIVWPIDELIDENTRLRSASAVDYEPLDASAWLFFSTAGVDGIYFAHPRCDDGSCGAEVFAWNSFERRAYILAAGLEEFLVGWVRGTISV